MRFAVRTLPPAEKDANAIYDWIAENSVSAAERWATELEKTVMSLATRARIWARAPEQYLTDIELRSALFRIGSGPNYRVVFAVQ